MISFPTPTHTHKHNNPISLWFICFTRVMFKTNLEPLQLFPVSKIPNHNNHRPPCHFKTFVVVG